jgi:hypothetical protein
MVYTYPVVVVGTYEFPSYDALPDMTSYLAATITATSWFASNTTDQTRGQGAISALRWLESLTWQGQKSDPANVLAFPRNNLTYADGTQVDSATIPQVFLNAYAELAAMLVDTPDLLATFQNPRAKQLGAGSAKVEYFRPVGLYGNTNVQVLSPLPPNIMSYVGLWLAGNLPSMPIAKGDRGKSEIVHKDPYDFNHGF